MLTVIYVYMCVCILMDSSGKLTLSSGKSLNIISKSAISHISMLHSLIGSSGHQMSSIYPPVSSNMARWQNDFLIQTLKICRIFMDFPATFDDTPGYPLGPIGIIQKKTRSLRIPGVKLRGVSEVCAACIGGANMASRAARDESGWNTPGTVFFFLKHALGFVWWLFFYIDLYWFVLWCLLETRHLNIFEWCRDQLALEMPCFCILPNLHWWIADFTRVIQFSRVMCAFKPAKLCWWSHFSVWARNNSEEMTWRWFDNIRQLLLTAVSLALVSWPLRLLLDGNPEEHVNKCKNTSNLRNQCLQVSWLMPPSCLGPRSHFKHLVNAADLFFEHPQSSHIEEPIYI
jgi:hypothetical protein